MKIKKYKSFAQVDKEKLKKLIEAGFGKKLEPSYFEYAHPSKIYLAIQNGKYIGAAIVERVPDTKVCYLDKIVVAPEHQRNGVASGLIDKLPKSLVWRAKKTNTFVEKYKEMAKDVSDFPDMPEFLFFITRVKYSDKPKALAYARLKKKTI